MRRSDFCDTTRTAFRTQSWTRRLAFSARGPHTAAMILSHFATAFHISLLQPQGEGAPAAVLVHAAVSDAQQQVLYGALCDAAQETYEWQAQHAHLHLLSQ